MMAGEQRRRAADEALGITRRTMPVNVDLEQAVLGILLMNNNIYRKVAGILTADCFHEEIHKRIFNVIIELISQQKPASPITINTYLGEHDLGGMTLKQYVALLAASQGLPSELKGYAQILDDLRVRRGMISIATTLLDRSYDAPADDSGGALVDTALEQIASLRPATANRKGFERFTNIGKRVVSNAEKSFQADGRLIGLTTGLPRLDYAIGGLRGSDLLILAGRPSMGKSALGGLILYAAAEQLRLRQQVGEKTGVAALFSLEMSSEQFVERIICMRANVPGWKIRREKLQAADVEALDRARRELDELPIEINDQGGMTLQKFQMEARSMHKRFGLELIVVDYLQLMVGRGGKEENRARELAVIVQGLKELAKELDVPIVALSQLSRNVANREDKRPTLADLKESGAIEEAADTVMLLHREEYYLGKAPPEGSEQRMKWDRRAEQIKGVADVIIDKNRHGPKTTVELGFNGDLISFTNEPPERPEWSDEPRTPREKKKTLSVKAMQALKILRQLMLTHAEVGVELKNVPSFMTRPVSYLKWREECATQILDPDASGTVVGTFMTNVCTELKDFGLIVRAGTKDHPYAWATAEGQKYQ